MKSTRPRQQIQAITGRAAGGRSKPAAFKTIAGKRRQEARQSVGQIL